MVYIKAYFILTLSCDSQWNLGNFGFSYTQQVSNAQGIPAHVKYNLVTHTKKLVVTLDPLI